MTRKRCGKTARQRFNVSLGGGLGKLNGRVFRIGHLGDLNEPMVLGALSAVEMACASTTFRTAGAASMPRWTISPPEAATISRFGVVVEDASIG